MRQLARSAGGPPANRTNHRRRAPSNGPLETRESSLEHKAGNLALFAQGFRFNGPKKPFLRDRRNRLPAWVALACSAIGGFLLDACSPQQPPPDADYAFVAHWSEANGLPFQAPFGVAVDPRSGDVLVTDSRNHRVVILTENGDFVRAFGEKGDREGHLQRPTGIAVGRDGSIFVTDSFRDKVLKFTRKGEFVLEWGEPGEANDAFKMPYGLAIDAAGNVYVADFQNMAIKIFDKDGNFRKKVGGPNRLNYPTDIAMAEGGSFFVADAYNHRVQFFAKSEEFKENIFSPPENGGVEFNVPSGIAWDSIQQVLHATDSGNRRIALLDADGTFISEWVLRDQTEQFSPTMLAVSPNGDRVYATDLANNRILVLNTRFQ